MIRVRLPAHAALPLYEPWPAPSPAVKAPAPPCPPRAASGEDTPRPGRS